MLYNKITQNLGGLMTKDILKGLTILYVEDDLFIQENTVITLSMLELKVITASNGKEGVEQFQNNPQIDFILTDINMPIMNGLLMIEEIKKIRYDIPVIITTAHQEVGFLHKAIDLGVTSYIMKPIDIYKIIDALIKAVEPIILKKELINKNEELTILNNSLEQKVKDRTKELEILATIDPLTGINNRRNFFNLAKETFLSTNNNDSLFAAMMDIDKFKNFNDTYGHATGDIILKEVASTILSSMNEGEIFGRLGGEEFAIIFQSKSLNDAQEKIEEIRKKIENTKILSDENEYINCTISTGISQKNEKNDSVDSMLATADKALFEAKGSGRNQTVIFRS